VHELVAVGIKNKIFDHNVCYNFWSDALVRHARVAGKLIENEVASEGGEAAYLELRKLSIKWAKRTTKWREKQRRKAAKAQARISKSVQSAPTAGQSSSQLSLGATVADPPPSTTSSLPSSNGPGQRPT
jgi:hypothetical protein